MHRHCHQATASLIALLATSPIAGASEITPTHKNTSMMATAVNQERAKELDIMTEIERLQERMDKGGAETGHNIDLPKPTKPKPDKYQKYVDRHVIVNGMTPSHVVKSWGEPQQRIQQSSGREVWVFQRRDGRDQRIVFTNQRVIGWE